MTQWNNKEREEGGVSGAGGWGGSEAGNCLTGRNWSQTRLRATTRGDQWSLSHPHRAQSDIWMKTHNHLLTGPWRSCPSSISTSAGVCRSAPRSELQLLDSAEQWPVTTRCVTLILSSGFNGNFFLHIRLTPPCFLPGFMLYIVFCFLLLKGRGDGWTWEKMRRWCTLTISETSSLSGCCITFWFPAPGVWILVQFAAGPKMSRSWLSVLKHGDKLNRLLTNKRMMIMIIIRLTLVERELNTLHINKTTSLWRHTLMSSTELLPPSNNMLFPPPPPRLFLRTTEWTSSWGSSGTTPGWRTASTPTTRWTSTPLCWTPSGNPICSLPTRRGPTSTRSPPTTSCCASPRTATCSTAYGERGFDSALWWVACFTTLA